MRDTSFYQEMVLPRILLINTVIVCTLFKQVDFPLLRSKVNKEGLTSLSSIVYLQRILLYNTLFNVFLPRNSFM